MRSIAFGISLFLTGCSSLYPIAPNLEPKHLISLGKGDPLKDLDLADIRDLTRGLRITLESSLQAREYAELETSEIAYYASLVAIGGTFKDSIAARNTGGVLAILASVFTGRYKTPEQRVAFQNALRRVSCLENALAPIRPEIREIYVKDPEFPTLEAKYSAVPQRTSEALSVIETKLRADLAGIALGTLSSEQIAEIYKKWLTEKDEAEKKPPPTPAAIAKSRQQLQASRTISVVCTNTSGLAIEAIDECKRISALKSKVDLLLERSDVEIADSQQRFKVAVESFSAKAATCEVQPE